MAHSRQTKRLFHFIRNTFRRPVMKNHTVANMSFSANLCHIFRAIQRSTPHFVIVSRSFVSVCSASHLIWFLFLLCITNIADSYLYSWLRWWQTCAMSALNKLLRLKMCYTHKTFTITRERGEFFLFRCLLFVRYFLYRISLRCRCYYYTQKTYQKYFVIQTCCLHSVRIYIMRRINMSTSSEIHWVKAIAINLNEWFFLYLTNSCHSNMMNILIASIWNA